MVHIDALKLQIEQAENKLHRLREEEAAILDVFADHDRVFAPFRKLPEDVLREICVACVQDAIPELSYGDTPMPYILGQICSGMRHVALTTPVIWASMGVDLKQKLFIPLRIRPGRKLLKFLLSGLSNGLSGRVDWLLR